MDSTVRSTRGTKKSSNTVNPYVILTGHSTHILLQGGLEQIIMKSKPRTTLLEDRDLHEKAPQSTGSGTKSHGDPNPIPFEQVYELEREIGKGGYGAVHVARNRELGEEVAVKVIDRR